MGRQGHESPSSQKDCQCCNSSVAPASRRLQLVTPCCSRAGGTLALLKTSALLVTKFGRVSEWPLRAIVKSFCCGASRTPTVIPANEPPQPNAPTADLKSVMCTLKNVIFDGDSFCASCYYSHMTEPHAKPVLPERVQPKRERSA